MVSLVIYLLTLAPTITWAHEGADGGDLITAVVTGGVPHPHGYPTYLLLGEAFIRIPWGDFARRLNLMSATCAAIAAGLGALAVLKTCSAQSEPNAASPDRLICYLPAAGAGLAFAFSSLLWSQAVIAEVYAPATAFIAAIVALVVNGNWELGIGNWGVGNGKRGKGDGKREKAGRPSPPAPRPSPLAPRPSPLALLGFLWGLGLGVHLLLLLLAPVIGIALWRAGKRGLLPFGIGLLMGLGVFGILPLRARTAPPVNWGNAHTWSGFWWLVSGKLYHRYVFALPLRYWPQRLLAWGGLMARQFTPIGAFLTLTGLDRLWKRDRALTLALLSSIIAVSLYAIGYNTTDSYVYLTFTLPLWALFLGTGLSTALREIVARLPGVAGLTMAVVISLAIPGAELALNWRSVDLHADHEARLFGERVLSEAPYGAIVVTGQDAHTFTLWYFRYALGMRPDITVVDKDLLVYNWYRESLAREPGLEFLRREEFPPEPGRWRKLPSGRRIWWVDGGTGQ